MPHKLSEPLSEEELAETRTTWVAEIILVNDPQLGKSTPTTRIRPIDPKTGEMLLRADEKEAPNEQTE